MKRRECLRVLIVDDSEDDFDLITRALHTLAERIESHRVETARQMQAALAEPWDVVLVDWVLPQFDAPAALGLLAEVRPGQLCIVVSGIPGEAAAVTAIKLGAADFIRKDELGQLPLALERELEFQR